MIDYLVEWLYIRTIFRSPRRRSAQPCRFASSDSCRKSPSQKLHTTQHKRT